VAYTGEGDGVTYRMPPPTGSILLLSVLAPCGAIAVYLLFLLDAGGAVSHAHTSGVSTQAMLTGTIVLIVVASLLWVVLPTWAAFAKPQLVRVRGGELEIVGPGLLRAGTWRARIADIEDVRVGVPGNPRDTRPQIILAWTNFVRVVTRDGQVGFGRTLTKNVRQWLVEALRARVLPARGGGGIDTSNTDDAVEPTYKDLQAT